MRDELRRKRRARRAQLLQELRPVFAVAIMALIAGLTYHFVPDVPAAAEAQEVTIVEKGGDNKLTINANVSAYTSSADETDENPWENAAGTRPGPGSLACPSRFALGTEFVIEGEVYTCDDRMNKRYRDGNHFDVWVESKEEAYEFGRQELTITVHI